MSLWQRARRRIDFGDGGDSLVWRTMTTFALAALLLKLIAWLVLVGATLRHAPDAPPRADHPHAYPAQPLEPQRHRYGHGHGHGGPR